ncbi:MAG: DNA polymerase Y family protein [Novosphingobium sp.]|nr:DNA polymerase Y family protein [Novosphingobium sp.]
METGSDPARPDPFALVMRVGNALRLSAVNVPARRLGLDAGMTLADARACVPSLLTRPADPVADARALDRMAAAMARFTPTVGVDPPDGLILDITGCAHLFGGESGLARQAMALAGYGALHALASNAAAARAMARYGPEGEAEGEDGVRRLPLAALELDCDALAALRRAGLRTTGDLARLPMRAVAARFGEETVTRLRCLLGEAASPVAPRPARSPIRMEARFAEPLIRTDDVLDVIESLLVQAAREMEIRQAGGRRFVVELCRSDNARRGLMVETGQPVRDCAVVLRLLRERIETLADPLDPGFGFDSVSLAVLRAEPLPSSQPELGAGEGRDAPPDGLAALIDRLSVRLGPQNVFRLVPCDRHLPEKAQQPVPASRARGIAWPVDGDRLPRPLMLFDPPQQVEAIAGVPDGPPQRFRWRGRLHDVRLAEGPERIAAEWWRKRTGHFPGKAGPTRDYYRVEDMAGRRFWLFRHGLFAEKPDPRWYLHGLFA